MLSIGWKRDSTMIQNQNFRLVYDIKIKTSIKSWFKTMMQVIILGEKSHLILCFRVDVKPIDYLREGKRYCLNRYDRSHDRNK